MERVDLDKITSLADLEFKAQSNKYYRQLALIAAKYIAGNYYTHVQGKPVTDTAFKGAMDYLIKKWKSDCYEDCRETCKTINDLRSQVMKEPEPKPEPEKVDTLLKTNAKAVIEQLKKKNLKAKKTKIGLRSSKRSAATVRRSSTPQRRSTTRARSTSR